MQKKNCPILQFIGFVAVVAAAIIAIPKVICFVKERFAKNEVDDMEFEFEEEAEFIKPEPMEKEAVKPKDESEEAVSAEADSKDDIFVEE